MVIESCPILRSWLCRNGRARAHSNVANESSTKFPRAKVFLDWHMQSYGSVLAVARQAIVLGIELGNPFLQTMLPLSPVQCPFYGTGWGD
jgi:hypothetical protein